MAEEKRKDVPLSGPYMIQDRDHMSGIGQMGGESKQSSSRQSDQSQSDGRQQSGGRQDGNRQQGGEQYMRKWKYL